MKASTGSLLAALIAFGLTLSFYESRVIARQRSQLETQRKRLESAERQATEWRTRQTEAERDLVTARLDTNANVDPAAIAAGERGAHAAEIKSWLSRVKQLRQLLAQRPDQLIPEVRFLTDLDWLALAQRIPNLEKETDIREALARVRSSGKETFAARQLAPALKKSVDGNNGMLPADMMQLLPFFNPPIDPAILQRYELRQSGRAAEIRDGQAIVEKSPVDADYDSRVSLTARGSFGMASPWRAAEMGDDVLAAKQRFMTANNGRPPQAATDIFPYLQSPVARGYLEAMVAYQYEHAGNEPKSPAELLPYTKNPDARAEIERMVKYRAGESR